MLFFYFYKVSHYEETKPFFVILASDGLWDVFSNEEAVQFVRYFMKLQLAEND